MASVDLRRWAVKGAEQRLLEIADEARAIFATFPELRGQGRGFDMPRASTEATNEPAGGGAGRRKRRQMSPAARQRIGDAQRKRWAEVKARANAGVANPSDTAAPATAKASRGKSSRKKK